RSSRRSFPSSVSHLGFTGGSIFIASTNCTELWEILKANSLTAPAGPGLARIRGDSQKLNPPCGCSRLRGHSKSIFTVLGFICAWFKKRLVERQREIDGPINQWASVSNAARSSEATDPAMSGPCSQGCRKYTQCGAHFRRTRINQEDTMKIRVAAIEVSHWHALNDAAYLRHLIAMPDVELVAIQDSDAGLIARRAAEVGSPPTFTDYRQMLAITRPDFVVALGRHRQMAEIAHALLDQGYPFLMEKPMGINAPEVEAIAAKAARLNAFVAVPLAQRYAPFATRARELLAAGRFGPLSHIYVRINRPGPARYPAWDCAWMLDPAEAGGGCLRNLGPHGLDMFLHLTGEEAQVTGAQLSRRAHERPVEDYASVMLRSASG